METNVLQQTDVPSYENEEKDEINLIKEKATMQHEFSCPWDDSDLILVVEDQKLHVHRMILKMASPVFKVMLSSDFKEREAAEITLPGKKVNEFVDLLKLIYPLLKREMTSKNIEYIFKLADEYQMAGVMEHCRMFLASVKKTKENAMDMLLLAQVIGADEARQQCYDVLQQMTLTELEKCEGFNDLDGPSFQTIILPRVVSFQDCIKKTIPEIFGLIDCLLYLWCHKDNNFFWMGRPTKCPKHYQTSNFSKNLRLSVVYDIMKCDACRVMLRQMATKSDTHYANPSGMCLSENIVVVLEKMLSFVNIKE